MAAKKSETAVETRVFISYSRRDLAFADQLDAALRSRGVEPLLDRSEVYAFEDWWKRIQALLAKSDTVIFVLSPDALSSDVCRKEIEFAASLNKRFAPIVARPVDVGQIPETLRRLNFVFFDGTSSFDAAVDQLVAALSTDIEWIRRHTEFGELARRWSEAGRPGPQGLLLRSPLLEEAERWIAARPQNAPPPTGDTQALIVHSRRAATRQRNRLSGGLAVGLVLALALASVAYWQRGLAVEQRSIAVEQRAAAEEQRAVAEEQRAAAEQQRNVALTGQSRFLADFAMKETERNSFTDASLLALEGLVDETSDDSIRRSRPFVAEAQLQLDIAFRQMREVALLGHGGRIEVASFSSDGNLILTTSSQNNAVALWNAADGKQIITIRQARLRWAFLSPDAKKLAITYGSFEDSSTWGVALWDVASRRQIASLDVAAQEGLTFSPDSSRLVAHASSFHVTYDVNSGRRIAQFSAPAAFSPDLSRMAIGSGGTVRIFDTTSGSLIADLDGGCGFKRARFSPDGSLILVSCHDGAGLWDATGGRLIAKLDDAYERVFSPNGRRLALTKGASVRLIDTQTGAEVATLAGHRDQVYTVLFSPDSARILTAAGDPSGAGEGDPIARLWNAETGASIAELRGHSARVAAAAFSPDSRLIATVSFDATARVWGASTGQPQLVLAGHRDRITRVAFDPGGARILTGSWDGTARLWNIADADIDVLVRHSGPVHTAVFSPDGTGVLTASEDGTAVEWGSSSGRMIQSFRHDLPVRSAAFSPDGQSIVTASSPDIVVGQKVVRVLGRGVRADYVQNGVEIPSAAFTPDGRFVLIGGWTEQGAALLNVATGGFVGLLPGQGRKISSATFTRDGARAVTANGVSRPAGPITGPRPPRPLAAAGDHTARIWDMSDLKQIAVLSGHEGPVSSAAFSSDGAYVVTASGDRTARLWDAKAATQLAVFRHPDYVSFATFSPDGRRVGTAGADGVARVWDVATGKPIAHLKQKTWSMSSASFSPDGKRLVTASDSEVRIWRLLEAQELVEAAKKKVIRCLDRAQRESALLEPTPPDWCIDLEKWPYNSPEWKAWLADKRSGTVRPLPTQ